jgi:hypothetical protein
MSSQSEIKILHHSIVLTVHQLGSTIYYLKIIPLKTKIIIISLAASLTTKNEKKVFHSIIKSGRRAAAKQLMEGSDCILPTLLQTSHTEGRAVITFCVLCCRPPILMGGQ